jgi:hypothetical protein
VYGSEWEGTWVNMSVFECLLVYERVQIVKSTQVNSCTLDIYYHTLTYTKKLKYTQIHFNTLKSVYACISVDVSVFERSWVYLSVVGCISVFFWVYLSVFECISVYLNVFECIWVFVSVWESTNTLKYSQIHSLKLKYTHENSYTLP